MGHAFQSKLLIILNEMSLRGKWTELTIGLKYLNGIITRNYIDSYWKYLFQIVYKKLPKSIEDVPQFIDCLQAMNIRKQNEIVYSFVLLLLSKNLFQSGYDLLQMYHLTAKYEKEEDINTLVNSLNADFEYIKWKRSLKTRDSDFHQQLAEKCSFQLQQIVDNLDITDTQILKLKEIYLYYDKIHELEELLENYSVKHPEYINAQKYLFDFLVENNNVNSLEIFSRIAKISPSDSYILKYCRKFNDLIMSIDCIFDMLDHFQWKYSKKCWSCLKELLITSERSDGFKECIKDNWMLRKKFWIPYHFKRINNNKKFKKVNLIKLEVAIIFMGPANDFVKKLIVIYDSNIKFYKDNVDAYNWIIEDK